MQNTAEVMENDKKEINTKIKDIIETDDMNKTDEEAEKNMFSEKKDYEMEKCKIIQNRMNSFTRDITYLLYRNYKNNITDEKVLLCVKATLEYRKQKIVEDKCEILAKNIIDFLNKNGIIESDEGYPDTYYFTVFGNKYIHYFMHRII